jgi:hypothetical protein
MSADRKEDLYQILNHNLVTFGAVRAAQDILNEVPASYPRYMTLSRYYAPDEIKRNNVVLVGGKKAVPWDHLFDDEVNFLTDYDDVHAHGFVRNRHPRPGEQATYDPSSAPSSLMAYSVIAYLPNPSGTGNAIILAGTDSDATEAAAEFLISEPQMEQLQTLFHSDHLPYFEVLLRSAPQSQPKLSRTFGNEEKEMIETALRESGGRVSGPSGAAGRPGIPGSTLDSRVRSLTIDKNRFKTTDHPADRT